MKSILVLGAGFVAAPLVDYLSQRNYRMTVASYLLEEADAIASRFPNVDAQQLDVSDHVALSEAIKAHDMVVSFVPFVFHETVAEACIAERRSLVTASYETDKMRSLHSKAQQAGITIVNEIGLDPGIDHLSAMKIFDEIECAGETLDSFVSWCGGLPAQSANDNPLGYKFSWSPRSVLLAVLNDAKYVLDGKVELVPADQLLTRINQIEISPELLLEGYANRDSTSYVDIYNIPTATKVLRGTLRYPGFCEIIHTCKEIGLLDRSEERIKEWQDRPWADYIADQTGQDLSRFVASLSGVSRAAIEFLELQKPEQCINPESSILDAFCKLLTDKISFKPGERDMIVMQHEFISHDASGTSRRRTSTLVLEGDPEGYSAMAKTVGTPAAITTDMIMKQEIKRTGVVLPMTDDFYNPILERLAEEGIEMEERTYTN